MTPEEALTRALDPLAREVFIPRGVRIGPTTTLSSTKLPYWK